MSTREVMPTPRDKMIALTRSLRAGRNGRLHRNKEIVQA
jgi:hypothetical protein